MNSFSVTGWMKRAEQNLEWAGVAIVAQEKQTYSQAADSCIRFALALRDLGLDSDFKQPEAVGQEPVKVKKQPRSLTKYDSQRGPM